ncbi:MarR family winged helix-turn-helix transcriptional regulator, partial [Paractinoplanes abujensis]
MLVERRGTQLYEVLRTVRPLVLNSARVVEADLAADGLTVGMRAVLEVLAEGGPATVPAIGDTLDLARQGIQRHVNDLGRLGLVEVRDNPAHRRSVLVALTPQGTRRFARIKEDELTHLDRMAADCTDAEIDTAVKVLRSLNRDVRRRAGG